MRALTALLLSLLLAVTSVTMATARGEAPIGQTMTLCSEGGTITVTLDANGNPVAPHAHLCPDCLSAVLAANLPAPLAIPTRPLTKAAALPLPTTLRLAGLAHRPGNARAPPTFAV